jgi:hypothetical protein
MWYVPAVAAGPVEEMTKAETLGGCFTNDPLTRVMLSGQIGGF